MEGATATTTKVTKKVQGKSAAAADHPKYSEMIKQALAALKERGGSSRQAVLKYIMANFKVGRDEASVNSHLKMALRAGVKNSSLKQSKGTGASGSFRLGAVATEKPKKKAATGAAKKKSSPVKKAATGTKKTATTKKPKAATEKKPVAEQKKKAVKAPVKAKKSGGRSTPKSPKKVVKKAAAAAPKKPAAKPPTSSKVAPKKAAPAKPAAKKPAKSRS